MARRNAFTDLYDPPSANAIGEDSSASFPLPMQQPLDFIPIANRKKKRTRHWEQLHRHETVTYRGISPQAIDQVNRLAESLAVPRDEVVRALLDYSTQRYRSGKLYLYAYPKAQRMTLFPENQPGEHLSNSPSSAKPDWLAEAFPHPAKNTKLKKHRGGKDPEPSRWETRVTFRIPAELKAEVRSIASDHTVAVGELVWFFLLEGIKALQNGNLSLQASPKTVGKTLFLGDDE